MRRTKVWLAAGLCLASAAAWAGAVEFDGKSGQPAPVSPSQESCGNNATAVHFEDSPSIAPRKARKEHKLVFVLHVSGLFEDPRKT